MDILMVYHQKIKSFFMVYHQKIQVNEKKGLNLSFGGKRNIIAF